MVDPSEVVVMAEVTAKPGLREALRDLLEAAIAPSRSEPGNIVYRLHEDRDVPGHFVFYERWRDRAAIDAHLQSAHFRTLMSGADQLVTGAPRLTLLQAVSE